MVERLLIQSVIQLKSAIALWQQVQGVMSRIMLLGIRMQERRINLYVVFIQCINLSPRRSILRLL